MKSGMLLRLAVGMTLVLVVAGCGGGDDDNQSAAPSGPAQTAAAVSTTAATAAAAVATPAGPQLIEIKAAEQGDTYTYEPNAITVKPGAITVKFNNTGPSRPHTLNVKNKDGQGDLAKIQRTEVGQSGTVEFTISEEGTYEIYCSLPGHADRGQKGTFTVARS